MDRTPEEDEDELPGGDGSPPMDFVTFVLSMSTSCMVALGEIAGPDGEAGADLALARQTIEILELLEERTRGNLSGEEEKILAHVLPDLRQRFRAKHAAG